MSEQDGREPAVAVYVTNAIRVSTGEPTPGVVHLPAGEAQSVIARRLGWPGDRPPRGWP